jgi:predicted nucleic acid-binding OB-fold protein
MVNSTKDYRKKINQFVTTDPLFQSLGENTISLFSFVLQSNRILSLCPENMAYRQFGSFIYGNPGQWVNLRPDDIVYLYGSGNGKDSLNEIRKIVKSIDLMEFAEQKELANNFLQTLELNDDAFIVAFKV